MKLLLDEMWPPEIAVQLRQRGHDVEAVVERQELRGTPDSLLFEVAQLEHRAIVTENVSDFRVLAQEILNSGSTHAGLILTTNQRHPRHDAATIGRLVLALNRVLNDDALPAGFELWLP